ncbi:MAG: hypothetical protein ABI178_09320 [Rhodanobacter sp.]
MSSLWKDLLFLHGYLVRKEDLVWHDQTSPEPSTETAVAGTDGDTTSVAATNGTKSPTHCVSHWPRLAAPR